MLPPYRYIGEASTPEELVAKLRAAALADMASEIAEDVTAGMNAQQLWRWLDGQEDGGPKGCNPRPPDLNTDHSP